MRLQICSFGLGLFSILCVFSGCISSRSREAELAGKEQSREIDSKPEPANTDREMDQKPPPKQEPSTAKASDAESSIGTDSSVKDNGQDSGRVQVTDLPVIIPQDTYRNVDLLTLPQDIPNSPKDKQPFRRLLRSKEGYYVEDSFRVWGWSEDGYRIAYGRSSEPGGADCAGRSELQVVSKEDGYALPGGLIEASTSEGDYKTCDPDAAQKTVARKRLKHLSKFGIRRGLWSSPIKLYAMTDENQYRAFDPIREIDLLFRLEVIEHDADNDVNLYEEGHGASYRLEVRTKDGEFVTIEDGKTRRPGTIGYTLEHGLLFIGPRGKNAAVFLSDLSRGFEQIDRGKLANIFSLEALQN